MSLGDAYDAEIHAYYVLEAERCGNPVRSTDLKNRRVSTERLAEAQRAWLTARFVLQEAGGTPETIRELLESRAAKGKPERRKLG